jgi:hypothetical protein
LHAEILSMKNEVRAVSLYPTRARVYIPVLRFI